MKTLQVLSLSLLLMVPASMIAMEKSEAVDPVGAAQAAGSSESPRGASDSESRSEKHGHRHHRSEATRKLFGKKKVEIAAQPVAADTHAQDISDLKTRVESLEKKASRLKFVSYGSAAVFTVALAWIAYQLLYHSHADDHDGDTDDEYDESSSAQPQTK